MYLTTSTTHIDGLPVIHLYLDGFLLGRLESYINVSNYTSNWTMTSEIFSKIDFTDSDVEDCIHEAMNGIDRLLRLYQNYTGQWYKAHSKVFGFSTNVWKGVVGKAMMEAWIDPIRDQINEVAYTSAGVSPYIVKSMWLNKEIIEQTKEDGLSNILPHVYLSGVTPQELKKIWGKSKWKKLCSYSKTRNRYIAKIVYSRSHPDFYNRNSFAFVDRFQWVFEMPTTILRRGYSSSLNSKNGLYIVRNKGRHSLKSLAKGFNRDDLRLMRIVGDTERMASQLGEKFNFNWSPRKMQEKHDEYSYRIAMKDVRNDPIEWYQEYGLPEVWTDDEGHTFTLLKTGAEIKKEGLDMKHCVGSYYQRCYNKGYVVYSVENPEGERSTLGIHVDNGGSKIHILNGNVAAIDEEGGRVNYIFNQMYGVCNKMVGMKEEDAANYLISHLSEYCRYPKEQNND